MAPGALASGGGGVEEPQVVEQRGTIRNGSPLAMLNAVLGAATALLGTEIGDPATVRLVILAVVNAYAFSRALICVVLHPYRAGVACNRRFEIHFVVRFRSAQADTEWSQSQCVILITHQHQAFQESLVFAQA